MNIIEGSFINKEAKVAIVVARFNSFINESLLIGAKEVLLRQGCLDEKNITIVKCPGAYEIPLITKKIAKTKKYDAIIALGSVIRGGTPHFEYVSSACNSGLMNVGLEYEVPVAFGVLTVDSIEQAIERAGTKAGNKGEEAALSALEMISVLSKI